MFDQILGRWVAVKQYDIASQYPDLPEPLALAQREGRIAGGFGLQGVVRVFDLAMHDGCPWLVVELLSGWSLAAEITCRGRLQVERTARIAGALLTVLEALHADGVIHRDVKPANILFSPATDLFALGVTLFCTAEGYLPYTE